MKAPNVYCGLWALLIRFMKERGETFRVARANLEAVPK